MGWIKYSPSDFVFTAKLPKTITHDKALGLKEDVKADLSVFLDLMQPLQLSGKLACLLIQLPPKYGYNPDNLENFFRLLDPTFKYAVEFRNSSWLSDDTWRLLKKYEVAYTVVDEPLLPPEIHLTTDFAYFRWHGKAKKSGLTTVTAKMSWIAGFRRFWRHRKGSRLSMATLTIIITVTPLKTVFNLSKSWV